MRLAPLLALLALAPALHAQPCVPDPAPPESYYPLGVGDEWIYHAPAFSGSAEAYVRRRVLREETVGGQAYAVDQVCLVAVQGGTPTCRAERLVRFDGANVVERTAGGEAPVFEGLNAPFGQNPLNTCATDLGSGPVVIGGYPYAVPRVKALPALDFGPPPFASGIGPLGLQVGNLAERTDRFEYARVGGVEYGVRPPGTPDPTSPADYYPLEVGNQWEYRPVSGFGLPSNRWERRTVVRTETVDGAEWFVERVQSFRRLGPDAWETEFESDRFLRFDPPTANVVMRLETGPTPYPLYVCRLDLPLTGPTLELCSAPPSYEYTKRVGPTGFGTAVVLQLISTFGGPRLAAGIGEIGSVYEGAGKELVYARVGNAVLGTPTVGMPPAPVAGEASPGTAGFALVASPNPTSGPITLALTLPAAQTVAVEAFDALGRRVWQQEMALGVGAQTVAVDASAWAPGVYVVRATAGRASATARVVRR